MQSQWDRFGRDDPMHAILALDHPITDQEFLSGGRRIVEDIMAWAFDGVPRRRLLEIGCGMGRTAASFAGFFQSVDAIDVAPSMVQRARDLCRAPNLHFHVADGSTLKPFENHSCDAVFSFLVLQHIPSETVLRGLLHEVARVLARDGRACLQFDTRDRSWLVEAYKSLPDPLLPRKHRRFMRRYRRSAAALRAWMNDAGLAILRERDPGTDTHFFVLTRATIMSS
jgi:SAM-dependent methyltransferase